MPRRSCWSPALCPDGASCCEPGLKPDISPKGPKKSSSRDVEKGASAMVCSLGERQRQSCRRLFYAEMIDPFKSIPMPKLGLGLG